MKKEISRAEYQQLWGLLLIARRHNDAIRQCIAAVGDVLGEPDPDNSLFADEMWSFGEPNADALLRRLKVEILDGR